MSATSRPTGTPVLSVAPVTLSTPGRPLDLELRITAPTAADGDLPVILLSHGQGYSNHLSSLHGYGPLADRWAAQGFAVLQPTHLSSRTLTGHPALSSDDPEAPLYWRSRAEDMSRVLDRLDAIEAAVPQLPGRLDRDRIAVAGHSMGGHTASLLLGARVTDPHDGTVPDLADPRIKAGVLLAAPGRGGDAVTEFVAEHYSVFLTMDFSRMTAPALVVAGDKDASTHLTVRGPEWHTDPYVLSPGPKSLLTLFDAEHGLGGVAGYDVAETTDENPARVAAVAGLSAAYLGSRLFPGDPARQTAWQTACDALAAGPDPLGHVESK